MTRLIKPVRRRVSLEIRNAPAQEIVVTLYPNGMIGFRKTRKRTEVVTSLSAAYWLAWKAAAELKREAKRVKVKK